VRVCVRAKYQKGRINSTTRSTQNKIKTWWTHDGCHQEALAFEGAPAIHHVIGLLRRRRFLGGIAHPPPRPVFLGKGGEASQRRSPAQQEGAEATAGRLRSNRRAGLNHQKAQARAGGFLLLLLPVVVKSRVRIGGKYTDGWRRSAGPGSGLPSEGARRLDWREEALRNRSLL
jgi:hypothetical protein